MIRKKRKRRRPGVLIGGKGILALLTHYNEEGWTAAALAEATVLSAHTVRHHLQSLNRYGQATSSISRARRPYKGNPQRTIEVRTKIWSITKRGRGRLEYRGGHDEFCPVCV